MIVLGTKVRDKFTGFSGVAVGRTEWIFGCTRYAVEATELHEGKPIEAQWFDEQRLELLQDAPAQKEAESKGPGGPQRDPVRSSARP